MLFQCIQWRHFGTEALGSASKGSRAVIGFSVSSGQNDQGTKLLPGTLITLRRKTLTVRSKHFTSSHALRILLADFEDFPVHEEHSNS